MEWRPLWQEGQSGNCHLPSGTAPTPIAKTVNLKKYHNPGGTIQISVIIKYLRDAGEVIPTTLTFHSCLAGAKTRWITENDYRLYSHSVTWWCQLQQQFQMDIITRTNQNHSWHLVGSCNPRECFYLIPSSKAGCFHVAGSIVRFHWSLYVRVVPAVLLSVIIYSTITCLSWYLKERHCISLVTLY